MPDSEGIFCASGDSYEIQNARVVKCNTQRSLDAWLDVAILAQKELDGGQYRVTCGESLAHGSIGVVVLEWVQTGEPIWIFVSNEANPFNQIEIKGSYILVLSTSGSIFRFRPTLQDVSVLIP